MIGSRLEADASAAACRLAFYGRLVALVDAPDSPGALAELRLFKLKSRAGSVERAAPDVRSAICKGMFKRDTDISRFVGLQARMHPVYSQNVPITQPPRRAAPAAISRATSKHDAKLLQLRVQAFVHARVARIPHLPCRAVAEVCWPWAMQPFKPESCLVRIYPR